jgi:hypothetical protein
MTDLSPPDEPLRISERASDAIERFAKQAEKAQTETRGDKRFDATRRYAATRAALSPRELAILDMTALKRRTLADLAAQTKQSPEALTRLLIEAGERLADYFEAG